MSRQRIPFIKPVMPDPEFYGEVARDIHANNWYTNFGPFENRFRQDLIAYMGEACEAVTFNNATSALMLAMQARFGRGDGESKVITPSFTFAAGPEAIVWCNHTPLFIDIDEETLQPSLEEARRALEADQGSYIKGILFCNTFGVGAESVGDWEALAHEFGLPLIIDSAAGFGSKYPDGRKVGLAGDCEIFSFHATKPFAVGEGGAVITKDKELSEKLLRLQNFGFDVSREVSDLGLNGKLAEILAAIGSHQLGTLDRSLDERKRIHELYMKNLGGMAIFHAGAESSSLCFGSIVLPSNEERDRCIEKLTDNNIEVRKYFEVGVADFPYFRQYPKVSELRVTKSIGSRVLSLPLYPGLTENDITRISSHIVC